MPVSTAQEYRTYYEDRQQGVELLVASGFTFRLRPLGSKALIQSLPNELKGTALSSLLSGEDISGLSNEKADAEADLDRYLEWSRTIALQAVVEPVLYETEAEAEAHGGLCVLWLEDADLGDIVAAAQMTLGQLRKIRKQQQRDVEPLRDPAGNPNAGE